jgi:rubrerythrin
MDGTEQRGRDRREFLRAAGFSGAALMLAACADGSSRLLEPGAARLAIVNGNNVTLDFSTDTDILNYAYALEQLEAAFYVQVVANAAFGSIFPANEQRILVDLRDHEVAHRDFFAAALGSAKIPDLTPDFSAVDFASRASVLQTAQTFEDLGVGAYNGAAKYLRSAGLLTIAGKIVSVEARHASAIRATLNGNRTGAFAPQSFDPALEPSQVLAAADPFIVQNITVINAA